LKTANKEAAGLPAASSFFTPRNEGLCSPESAENAKKILLL
jgi:hypothetical protein